MMARTAPRRPEMNPIETEHVLDADGVLHLNLPVGAAEAGRKVRVTVTLLPRPVSQEEYQRIVAELAGSWGDDVRLADEDDPSPVQVSPG
jgi:hypothetical protein